MATISKRPFAFPHSLQFKTNNKHLLKRYELAKLRFGSFESLPVKISMLVFKSIKHNLVIEYNLIWWAGSSSPTSSQGRIQLQNKSNWKKNHFTLGILIGSISIISKWKVP